MPISNPESPSELVTEILGYLNLSSGSDNPQFEGNFNCFYGQLPEADRGPRIAERLLDQLKNLQTDSPAFQNCDQAEAVIQLTFRELMPAYREHHADLLAHLPQKEFFQPFLLARMLEAVLRQDSPWRETSRIVQGALDDLNDYMGYRPLAVLENGREMQPYSNERYRPVPLYIKGAGVACGRYQELIEHTIRFLHNTPAEILQDSYILLDKLSELAVDVRAHDHLHPVNKRTNYMFGEWDPHQIDNQGYYSRFIIREIILNALLQWMNDQQTLSREEILYDASAVLTGTILMASSVSGCGPHSHSSDVTLTSLLPTIAQQRDAFYNRVMAQATGERARRLQAEADLTQQPFGPVRQYLNMHLAHYGAQQVQLRHVARLFASMGYSEQSRQIAAQLPATSVRVECDIQCLLTSARYHLEQGRVNQASDQLQEIEELIERGIACGALIDPWNILAFQGQFPLFHAREDSISDHRVESLLDIMEQLFHSYTQALGEAAIQNNGALLEQLSGRFKALAEKWDRYATTAVEDLPHVSGRESWESAEHVTQVMRDWRAAGESAGDIAFWRKHVSKFESAKAYALVVQSLLRKQDHVAAMGLLMQWLSEAETVGLESGPYSIFKLLREWLDLVIGRATASLGTKQSSESPWAAICRLFDYLEANAGEYWTVPTLSYAVDSMLMQDEESMWEEEVSEEEVSEEWEELESDLYEAAYDGVVYRDSGQDGHTGDTVDGNTLINPTAMERIFHQLEPRLKFLSTLLDMWQQTASTLLSHGNQQKQADEQSLQTIDETLVSVKNWIAQTETYQNQLKKLLKSVWEYEIEEPDGDVEANIEYDIQWQAKYHLLHLITTTCVTCSASKRLLLCLLPQQDLPTSEPNGLDETIISVYRSIFQGDVKQVRRHLPTMLKLMSDKPLLYVPFESGGYPAQIVKARELQSVFRELFTLLPRLGLLDETHTVLRAAYRMERTSRPMGPAVTEFDRLYRIALQHSLQAIIDASAEWEQNNFADQDLIGIIGEVIQHYMKLWLRHSDTMRLSNVEIVSNELEKEELREFISTFGADLFQAKLLSLGNVRSILHLGIEQYLEILADQVDPLHPIKLIEQIENEEIDLEETTTRLELIYRAVVDRFDRFVEYNTTTTQSDYGERFYCLLEFLQAEAEYERDDWNLTPVRIAHQIMILNQKHEAAQIWEKHLEQKTTELADKHLIKLARLEQEHGMRLPSLADHLNERFVKPLAVNRMVALVPQAATDAREERLPSAAFAELQREIDAYHQSTQGSSIDVPGWLRNLEESYDDWLNQQPQQIESALEQVQLPAQRLSHSEVNALIIKWNEPRTPRVKKKATRRKKN